MPGSRSSKTRRHFDAFAALIVAAILCGAALAWFSAHGFTLYYGDATAHLNVARRVIDSRTPGYDQIGTVWLPLPHLLMLPFVGNEWLWRTGLAGAGTNIIAVGIITKYQFV